MGSTTSRIMVTALFLTAVLPDESSAAATGDNVRVIEEVIVTAQRREQSLQDVPLSITSLSNDALQGANVTSTEELALVTPGLTMTQQQLALTPFIRGVGTQSGATGVEGAVAIYVDGVYIPSPTAGIFSLNSIDRVEVLRGPQGTLFGRNVTGGLVHVVTRDPQSEPLLDLGVSYGSYNTTIAKAYASGGFDDRIAADLAIYNLDQRDGYGENLFNGNDLNYRDEFSARSKILATLADNLTLRFTVDYNKTDNDLGGNRIPYPGTVLFGGYEFSGDSWDGAYNLASYAEVLQKGVSAKITYDLPWGTISSLTAARKDTYEQRYDNDATPLRVLDVFNDSSTETFQQEFLIQGGTESVAWTGGVFFYDAEAKYDPLTSTSPLIGPANLERHSTSKTESWAVFGQATLAVTEATSVTAGVRYTDDQLKLDGEFIALEGHPAGPGTIVDATSQSDSFDATTWRLSIDHNFDDDLMAYFSVARGFKSGGFNTVSISQPSVDPEFLDAYEAGVKVNLLDRRVRVNTSAFYYEYDDIQLNRVTTAGLQTLNAANAEVKGAEVEIVAAPSMPLGFMELTAQLALLDGTYDQFENAPIVVPAPAICEPVPMTTGTPTGGNVQCTGDASGNDMIRSPEWTLGLGITYAVPIRGREISINANYLHNDGFYWEPSNRLRQPSYDLINAQIAYGDPDGSWSIRLFGRNLTDELYYSSGSEQGLGDLVTAAAPRTFGVGVDVRLGGR